QLAGDANQDGILSHLDLAVVDSLLGVDVNDDQYDPKADIDGNGRINANDRLLVAENLGRRAALPSDDIPLLQNRTYIYDVNGDDQISAIDALHVINFLSRHGFVTVESAAENANGLQLNVHGESRITPLSALRVINQLSLLARLDFTSGESTEEAGAVQSSLSPSEQTATLSGYQRDTTEPRDRILEEFDFQAFGVF
ncbi:MAG: dockerin type I domain-containing protein, partial [Planctomycetota bacterium]